MANKDRVQEVRDAVAEVFGEYMNPYMTVQSDLDEEVRKCVDRDIYSGEDDPGGWSRNAVAVIHCESGIPNGAYDNHILEMWHEVCDKLPGLFVEHYNAAVICVYED